MSTDVLALKRAYEIGRARVAITRAFVAAVAVAIAAALAIGRVAAPWAIASFVVLAILEWRGGALARGGWRGFVAGLVALAIPMSVLRPCCDAAKMAGGVAAACCTMPAMCGASGMVVGLLMSLAWPRESSPRSHALAGVGVALGALSVMTTRCAGLFVGEAMGLAFGLLGGIVASGAARTWLSNRVRV